MKTLSRTTRSRRRERPSNRLLRAAALFDVALRRDGSPLASLGERDPRANAAHLAHHVDALLQPGQVAFITGPSGAGKSLLLRALAKRCPQPVWARTSAGRGPMSKRDSRRVVDLFHLPLQETLGLLAHAGLAESRLLSRQAPELSEGQRFRLALALAMERAEMRRNRCPDVPSACLTLFVDEFASTLDRPSALALAGTIRKWMRSAPDLRVALASAHDDLIEALAPDVLVYVPLAGGAEVMTR